MTLRRQMVYQIAAMIVALLLISAASLWGVNGLRQEYGSAIAGYEELRELYEARSHVLTARTLVGLSRLAGPSAAAELKQAQIEFEAGMASRDDLITAQRREQFHRIVRGHLNDAMLELQRVTADPSTYNATAQRKAMDPVLDEVSKLVDEIRSAIEQRQQAASHKRQVTMIVMSALSAAVILGAVIVGIAQYRSVMRPLKDLGAGVRRLAEGKLSERIAPRGHGEFAALANDFNTMAGELDGLYRELEQKVAQKSKDLVRSERLASVGYLAAGVAHEINNPIGIIAGYAELTLTELTKDADGAADARKALAVICEEAFRCKAIVQKLLTLARPGEEKRSLVALDDVARHVVSIVAGLKEYEGRRIALEVAEAPIKVLASEGEMKQVVLNLTLNALAATSAGGEVKISVRKSDKMAELSVQDNGRGMSPEVLERVFEPFFTAKRGSGQPGTGLGLSITHAIVENHGGRIAGSSDGVGQGSRFVVQLPVAGEAT